MDPRGDITILPFGHGLGEINDEPQPIRKIFEARLLYEPIFIQFRVIEHEPRQCLGDTSLQIGLRQSRHQHFPRILSPPRLHISESWVSQISELASELICPDRACWIKTWR
jgi:hypothetical protein